MEIASMKFIQRTVFLLSVTLVYACSSADTIQTTPEKKLTRCENPRPEICTQDYNPVCATKDNDVRCLTTPCPSDEKSSYSNGCSACADPKVFYHEAGACP